MKKVAPETPSIQSLDRGLMILEAVATARSPVPLSDLREMLDINRSSVFRLANTLRRRGFLTNPNGSNEYIIGPTAWRLFRNYDWSMLVSFCRHHLQVLSKDTGETSHLGVREGKQALFIAHQTGHSQVISVSGRTGEFMPLYCTAHGKALISDLDEESLRTVFGDTVFEKHTGTTVGSIEELVAACARVRTSGYALDDGEYHAEIRCLAVPIRDNTGEVVAAIGISAPVARMSRERCEMLAKKVMRIAKEIHVGLNAGA
jgi:DNA-binding IclR family transcriptional regulator